MDSELGNRRQPRHPVKDMTISINGKSYQVLNINDQGVGFLIDSPDRLEIGRELPSMLTTDASQIRVNGIPRHISQMPPANDGLRFSQGWICGTEFAIQQDCDGAQMLRDFIAENIEEHG